MNATRAPGRLRGRAAFGALRQGRRVRRGTITVTWAEGDPAQPPRVAYAVGRRAGSAVVRNRIRRRLRAIIRELAVDPGDSPRDHTGDQTGDHTGDQSREWIAPGAYLVGAGPDAATLPYDELKAMMTEALLAVTTAHRGRAERRP